MPTVTSTLPLTMKQQRRSRDPQEVHVKYVLSHQLAQCMRVETELASWRSQIQAGTTHFKPGNTGLSLCKRYLHASFARTSHAN